MLVHKFMCPPPAFFLSKNNHWPCPYLPEPSPAFVFAPNKASSADGAFRNTHVTSLRGITASVWHGGHESWYIHVIWQRFAFQITELILSQTWKPKPDLTAANVFFPLRSKSTHFQIASCSIESPAFSEKHKLRIEVNRRKVLQQS